MFFQLITYELKKLLRDVFFKVVLVLFLVLNIFLCAWYTKEKTGGEFDLIYRGYIDEVYDLSQRDPELFLSEFERVMEDKSEINLYGDEFVRDIQIFNEVKRILDTDKEYHKQIDSLISQSERILQHYENTEKSKTTFKYRYNKQIVNVYSAVNENVKLDNAPLRGWRELFTYEIDFYLLLIIVALCCISMATNDRKNGFYSVSGVCRYGRRETVLAKYVALLLVTVVLVLLFALTSLISVGVVCGYSNPFNAVQAVTELDAFPMATNMIESFMVVCVLRFLAMFSFSAALFAFSMWIKNQIICFGGAIGVFLVNYFVYSLKSFEVGQWKHINLLSLYFIDEYLVSYRALALFDHSINLTYVLILFMTVIFSVSPVIAVVGYTTSVAPRILKVLDITKYFHQIRRNISAYTLLKPRSMVSFELYKHRVAIILLVILVVLKVFDSSEYYEYKNTPYERMYKEYMSEIGGEYTEEKGEYIREQETYYTKIKSKYDSMTSKLQEGLITQDEYNTYLREYMVSDTKLNVLENLSEISTYLQKLKDDREIVGSFVYTTGYFLNTARGVDWLLLLFVVFLSCRFYLYESEKSIAGTSMDVVNRTTKKGRVALYFRKYVLCTIITLICCLTFELIDLHFLLKNYEMPDMTATVLSLEQYSRMPNISIKSYAVLSGILGVLGGVIISLLCFVIAASIKKMMITYAIAVAAIVVPSFAASVNNIFSFIDVTSLHNPDKLFRLRDLSVPLLTVLVFYGVFFGILVVLTVFSANKIKKGT